MSSTVALRVETNCPHRRMRALDEITRSRKAQTAGTSQSKKTMQEGFRQARGEYVECWPHLLCVIALRLEGPSRRWRGSDDGICA